MLSTSKARLLTTGNTLLVFLAVFVCFNYLTASTPWFLVANSAVFFITLLIISGIALFSQLARFPKSTPCFTPVLMRQDAFWLVAATIALSIPTLTLTLKTPLFGWDVLDFWALKAAELISSGCDESGTCTQISKKHPDFFIHFLAFLMRDGPNIEQVAIAWLLPYLAMYFIASGSGVLGRSGSPALYFVPFLILSCPIYINSVAIAGYVDIWVSIYTAAGSIGMTLYLQERRRIASLCLSILFLFFAGAIKAGSFLFSLVPLIAILVTEVIRRNPRFGRYALLAATCMLASLVWTAPSFDILIADHRVAYYETTGKLVFNTFSIDLTANDPTAALRALWHALALNASYSMSILFIAVAILGLRSKIYCGEDVRLYAYCLITLYALLLGILLMFVPHFYTAAAPESDTGLTRHAQTPLLVLSLTLYAATANRIVARKSTS